MKRIGYVDGIKGIGILLVVIGHHLLGVDAIIKWIYSFHMPLFFAVSGFLYSEKSNHLPIKEYVLKKAKSLMYPYFTLSAIVLAWHFVFYNIVFTSSVPETGTLQALILTVSTFGYHAFWFLPCLFNAQVLFRVLITRKFGKTVLAILTIVVVLIDFCCGEQLKLVIPYIYKYLFRVTIATSFLWLGYEFKKFALVASKSSENIVLVSSFTVSTVFFALNFIYPDSFEIANLSVANIGNPILFYITSISNSVLVFILCKKFSKESSGAFGFFGKSSIIVLALHMDITIEIAWIIINKFNMPLSLTVNSILAIILEILMLVVIILLMNKWFKWIVEYPFDKKKA